MSKRDGCPKCGEPLCIVQGCTEGGDRDGIRNNRWCEQCKTMFACHAYGFSERLVLMDKYRGAAKERIVGLLQDALRELT
jgi:transcriptional regulator NrdR family protein